MVLTGSRAHAGARAARLSDYDLEIFVSDMATFAGDEAWLRWFGESLVLFRDDGEGGTVGDGVEIQDSVSIARLVLYEDGTRIDHNVHPVTDLSALVEAPRLPDDFDAGYRVLLDKDGLARRLGPPTHRAYVRRRPTAADLTMLVEEFWWGTTCVTKHLWRDELLPARYSPHGRLDDLRRLLEWYVETEHGWSLPLGTRGRGFRRLLGSQLWRKAERTLAGASPEEHWAVLFALAALFGRVAAVVAARLEYDYPHDLDRRVTAYLTALRRLEG